MRSLERHHAKCPCGSCAAERGWETRRHKLFEDGQRPLPFRAGLNKKQVKTKQKKKDAPCPK
jgi:hypothetical protein